MLNEICEEISEHLIFFFIIFCLLCLCDISNKEAIHDQAVYESQFNLEFEIATGFEDAIIMGGEQCITL